MTKTPKTEQVHIEIETIASAMLDKKAQRVCAMDLRKPGASICDHFVICNADSSTQVAAIADNVEEMMWTVYTRKPRCSQGKENAFWVIIDYFDIVVHIFLSEYRSFYRLEELWADADTKHFNQ
ncbi:MAG: ribosome silencing factor [Prevotellaceae bacterium]|jgi:ribosome-associated protein|nr:ribosome silencing factor [Prevotellaceae bacterium]